MHDGARMKCHRRDSSAASAGRRRCHLPTQSIVVSSQPVGAGLLSSGWWADIAISLDLSVRELEIVQGIFDNSTEYTIATKLGISQHTVHTHINRVFRKLQVTTRTTLVLRVIREFLFLAKFPGAASFPIR